MIALKLLAALVCFLLTTSVFFWAANDAQRDVYMDEVFHVPQAQRYCDGNFTAVINAFSFVCFILISMHKVVFPILHFFTKCGDTATRTFPQCLHFELIWQPDNRL